MASAENATGFDLVWLGVDAKGQLAAFVTAGEGPIPQAALDATLAEPLIESQLLDLPVSSDSELLVDAPNPLSFVELAKRGLFVFDWTDVHSTRRESSQQYEMVCRPSRRLAITDLPPALQTVARMAALDDVMFDLQPSVYIQPVD